MAQDVLPRFQRRFNPNVRLVRGWVFGVPMLNVGLLLLMFYWRHADFVIQPGIVLDLPVAPFVAGAPYGTMIVTLTQEGLVFFNDERMTLSGLGGALARLKSGDRAKTLVIEADGQVPYRTLVEVYNKALAAGLSRVALATRPAAVVERAASP